MMGTIGALGVSGPGARFTQLSARREPANSSFLIRKLSRSISYYNLIGFRLFNSINQIDASNILTRLYFVPWLSHSALPPCAFAL